MVGEEAKNEKENWNSLDKIRPMIIYSPNQKRESWEKHIARAVFEFAS